jgi:dihydrofolate reductase
VTVGDAVAVGDVVGVADGDAVVVGDGVVVGATWRAGVVGAAYAVTASIGNGPAAHASATAVTTRRLMRVTARLPRSSSVRRLSHQDRQCTSLAEWCFVTMTVYYTATSVDGFIADPDNSLDWLLEVDREGSDPFDEFFAGVGAMCVGATSYEWMLEHLRPPQWRGYYDDTPCWVFTHRDLPAMPGANLAFVSGGVAPVHEAMVTAAAGRNVWLVGGGDLVGQFCDLGLLDEVRANVAPVFLGGGAPLLPRRLPSSTVRLADVRRAGQFVHLTYRIGRYARE